MTTSDLNTRYRKRVNKPEFLTYNLKQHLHWQLSNTEILGLDDN